MIIIIYRVWWDFIIFNYKESEGAACAYYQWHLNADKLFAGARAGIDERPAGTLIGAKVLVRFLQRQQRSMKICIDLLKSPESWKIKNISAQLRKRERGVPQMYE